MSVRQSGWTPVEFSLAWMLGLCLCLATAGAMAWGQGTAVLPTTTVADTIYRADGTAATGTVLLNWPAFTTAGGAPVPAGSLGVTIGAGGAFSVPLVSNAGSTPMGSYYTAVYHLDNGSVTREYWVVPVNASAVTVGAIRSTVLPTSVAMQTVSKSYVDTAITAALLGHPLTTTTPYVMKTGDAMTGPLVLPGDPVAPTQASDKHYVDAQIAGVAGGSGQKVSLLPQSTQTVTQPAGTQLMVNNLNGVQQADQYVSAAGNDGIAQATAGADCAGGCEVRATQAYGSHELVQPNTWKNQTHVNDRRGGGSYESFLNPLGVQKPGQNAGATLDVVSTQPVQEVLAATGAQNVFSTGLVVNNTALAGGSNIYPKLLQGTVPYFKTTFSALSLRGTNYTLGQHVLTSEMQDCYGVGDCLLGGRFMRSSGGFRDDADEGAHPFDLQYAEDTRVFTGSCAGGCVPGATVVQIAATGGAGTQGEGRYLLNTTASKVLKAGVVTDGSGADASGGARQPLAIFAGTNFPVSTLLETAQTIPTQANTIAPGTVSVPIVTTGVPPGFATNTTALPATTGVACVTDAAVGDGRPMNYETAAYTVVDGSHLQLTLNRPHGTGATVAVGGLCGYGLEQTVDTVNGIRQVFPVVASLSATTLLYAGGQTAIVGRQGLQSAFANVNLVVASIARANNVVTITTAGNLPVDVSGLTLLVQGVADASYNGSFVVTTTGSNTLQYPETGANSTSAGGTLSVSTGSFALYPMAEVLSVYSATTKAVDGQMTLAANTVNWAAGDGVEQPHYFQEAVSADVEVITQYAPRPSRNQSAGIYYAGNNGPGLRGWQINNASPASNYFGNGGTHTAPSSGLDILGEWRHSMELQAGDDAAIAVHCNSHGCNKWNSAYDLFQMDTSVGVDRMNYAPATSTLGFSLRGTSYQFSPQGLTAGTINSNVLTASTVNAGTIHGTFAGTVTAASLPVFGASGSGHQTGAVPDPGATAGATNFLREDGVWAAAGASTAVSSQSGYTTTGPASFPQRSKLLGEYLLTEGTGAIAHDTSGSGNDGAINGATWEGTTDLSFTAQGEYIGLPTALNGAHTWQFAMYEPPFGSAVAPLAPGYGVPGTFGGNASILCGTDTAHVCLIATSLFSPSSMRFMAYTTDHTEAGEALQAGWHVVTYICGTGGGTPAHILYDGAEVSSYLSQGTSTCGNPTSGNYQIGGSSLLTGSWFLGKVAAAWAWGPALSVSDASIAAKSAVDYMQAKGAVLKFRSVTNQTPVIIAGMDSRTYGIGVTTATVWPAMMNLTDPSYATRVNLGIPGSVMFDACYQFDVTYGQQIGVGGAPAIVMIWGGVNDFHFTNQTSRQVANSFRCIVTKAKSLGARVVIATEISSSSNQGTQFDVAKNGLNTILRAEAYGWGVDNLADLATDVHLGADGASNNTTCFPDNVHPGATCEPYVTAVMQDAVNELIGSSETSRHQTSAATYQELAGDRFLDLNGTAAQTVTLPSCTGYSLPRQMLNLGSVAGAAAPVSGQVLAGSTVLAPGVRAVFVPVPGALAAGGCSWERTQ